MRGLEDILRYQYLKKHCTHMCPGDRDGPEHPQLIFEWDIWNEEHGLPPSLTLDSAIDKAMSKQRAKELI